MKSLFLIVLCFFVTSVSAQTRQLKGTIKDVNGETLIGATVIIVGTKTGVVSDMNGVFSITVPADARAIEVSYVSYKTKTVDIQGKTEIEIVLEEDNTLLDEIVVVGYGSQKKTHLTGAVAAVTSSEITKRNAPNLSTALQGLMPGVSVVQQSGKPGADGGEITIRGRGSLNSSTSPLVLIDGMEGDLNAIDMSSVESISVLKDAASASIYGSRASNGVILVTTKRGTDKGIKVSYNGYLGINQPTALPTPLSTIDYMKYMNIANSNTNGKDATALYPQKLIEEYERYGADNYYMYDTDWKKEMLKDFSFTHKHVLSLVGGSDRINYFVSGSYYFQDGLIDNNSFDRKTLRVNTDTKITKWAKFGLDLNIRDNMSKYPKQATPEALIGQALTYSPVLGGINSDGTWGDGSNGYNPIAVEKAGGTENYQVSEIGIKGSLTLNPFKGFEVYSQYSLRVFEDKKDAFIRPYDTYVQGIYKSTYPQGATSEGKAEEYWKRNSTTQFNLQASYEKSLSDHNLKLLIGMQTEEINIKSLEASRTGFYVPGYEELSSGSEGIANGSSRLVWAMASYYGRLNYDYAGRYLFELSGRYDGSSRFAKGNRWGFFPAVSGAWRISEEKFFEGAQKTVNNLKVRASYGVLGNQWLTGGNRGSNAFYYPYTSTIYTGNYEGYWFNDTQYLGSVQKEMYNELISWEQSTQINAGIDASFLKNRLTFSFDYFVRIIGDLIESPQIPWFVGYKSSWMNAGELQNKGWDFTVTWRDKIGQVGYHVTANLSDVTSKLTKSYVTTAQDGNNLIKVGYPLNAWNGWVSDGYYQTDDDIRNSPAFYDDRTNIRVGDIKYKDISGPDGVPDGKIDYNDRKVIGDRYPRYEYSLNMGANWNNFDFTLFLQGVGKKEMHFSGNGVRPFANGRSMFEHQLDFWTEDNRNAAFPRLTMPSTASETNNYYISDFWVKSAAYMRIKNVVLGYTLPSKILNMAKLETVRFYLSAQNLFTFSNTFEGYDPETSLDNGNFYPVMRTFTFGLDVRF